MTIKTPAGNFGIANSSAGHLNNQQQ